MNQLQFLFSVDKRNTKFAQTLTLPSAHSCPGLAQFQSQFSLMCKLGSAICVLNRVCLPHSEWNCVSAAALVLVRMGTTNYLEQQICSEANGNNSLAMRKFQNLFSALF